MKELLEILATAERLGALDEPFAVATVVATSGSTYRKPGARQLITSTNSVGTVSGGCLDAQVRATAAEVMAEDAPRLEVYDLTDDDDPVWGWGLGCSGITEVLFEPSSVALPLLNLLQAALAADESLASVTLLDADLGRRAVFGASGISSSLGELDAAAEQAVAVGETGPVDLDGTRAFVEVVQPPPRLVVCGANTDVAPLVELAASLGWRPIVVDPRPRLLTEERFPNAQMLVTAEPSELSTVIGPDARTFAVLMNHNFLRDGDALAALLGTDVAYIGLLGPAERADQLLAYAAEQGVAATPDDTEKIYGPAGLDIGSNGPLEIAWSIMSEMVAVASGRGGGHLRP